MAAEDDYCQDCGRATEVAYDHSAGDAICIECGLVLESHMVDETAEWRTFADDDRDDNDPVRVGAPSNPFLEGQMLETRVVGKDGRVGQVTKFARGNAGNSTYSSSVLALKRIDELCERLGVNKTVKDLACELYAKVHSFNNFKMRRDNGVVVAACVHIACQKENQSRTLKEMRMAMDGVPEKKIVMAKNSIMKILNEKVQFLELGTEQASDYLKRFAHGVGLNNRAIKAAQEIFKNSKEHDIRRTPKSIAAGIIYIICQLCGYRRSFRDISIVANTSEGTIKKAFQALNQHLPLIVPSWFASETDLRKLCVA